MSERPYKIETDATTVNWMKSLRVCAPYYMDDEECFYHIFSEEQATARRFVIVPIPEFWIPSEDPVLAALKARINGRIYAAGVGTDEELVLSTPIEIEPVCRVIHDYTFACLLTSQNEEFFILHTSFNYWLLVGPPALVEEMAGTSLTESSRKFAEFAAAIGHDEPGQEVAMDIYRRYQVHNHDILATANNY